MAGPRPTSPEGPSKISCSGSQQDFLGPEGGLKQQRGPYAAILGGTACHPVREQPCDPGHSTLKEGGRMVLSHSALLLLQGTGALPPSPPSASSAALRCAGTQPGPSKEDKDQDRWPRGVAYPLSGWQ